MVPETGCISVFSSLFSSWSGTSDSLQCSQAKVLFFLAIYHSRASQQTRSLFHQKTLFSVISWQGDLQKNPEFVLKKNTTVHLSGHIFALFSALTQVRKTLWHPSVVRAIKFYLHKMKLWKKADALFVLLGRRSSSRVIRHAKHSSTD